MAKIASFPRPAPEAAGPPLDPQSEKIAGEIAQLLRALPATERDRVLQKITEEIRPISTPRAGQVLGTVVRLMRRGSELSVEELKQGLVSEGVQATPKEIYNSLGYLTRKRHIKRVGYGRYIIDGVGMVTADDLGGEPGGTEDD